MSSFARRYRRKNPDKKRRLPVLNNSVLQEIAGRESKTAVEIMGEGRTIEKVIEVATNATGWLDEMSAAIDREVKPELGCRNGCSWCCYQKVAILPTEAFSIVHHLRETLSADKFAEVQARIIDADSRTHGLTDEQRFTPELPCPLLDEGRCLAYEERPLACRGMSSFSDEACKRALLDPEERRKMAEEGATPIPGYVNHLRLAAAVGVGVRDGLESVGLSASGFEMNGALRVVLECPDIEERYLSGEQVFAGSLADTQPKEWVLRALGAA